MTAKARCEPGGAAGTSPPATVAVDAMRPFDLAGPLPRGLTVLEASAGTGKTFTIAGLATRYVAEGTPLDQLLIVTFTRAATGELRERVRQRLVSTERQLERLLAGQAPAGTATPYDPITAVLASGSRAQVLARRQALDVAIAEFDAATITTTHGFCQHMLASLGTAGDSERAATFSEDADDLIDEVVDDLYVRKYAGGGRPPFSRRDARRFVAKVVRNPGAGIEHANAPAASAVDTRERMASAARREVERRKLERATLGYDDLLTRLQTTLNDPARGLAAAKRLRARYKVALVDEFQDTDPIQWDILRTAFAHPESTLVLIGDPKQAIYSFRGADVWSYLSAARQADTRATLATNWRSDKALLDGIDALLRGSALGHPDIAYRHVEAAAANHRAGLAGGGTPAPLRFRVLHRADGVALTNAGFARKPAARERIARDLAAEAGQLLSSGAELVRHTSSGEEVARRPLSAGDLAVLVFTNGEAALVRDALDSAGVPAILHGGGSVFGTETARQWLHLLEALERPASAGRARTAALSPFVGWAPQRLAESGDSELGALQAELHTWAAVLARDGVAALIERMSAATDLPRRLLSAAGGERQLTDIHHIGQLLYAEALHSALGPSALAGWLRRRIAEGPGGLRAEDRARRLESDAAAVQVLTIHRAKGLEWPVVYLPFLWGNGPEEPDPIPVYHDPATAERKVDVRGKQSPNRNLYTAERRGEDLRLAYVALTRARNRVVAWWAGAQDARSSPLGRILFGTRSTNGTIADGPRGLTDEAVAAQLESLGDAVPGCITVEHLRLRPPLRPATTRAPAAELAVRQFDRSIDTSWRRTSYSALVSHQAGAAAGNLPSAPLVSSEPETPLLADERTGLALPPPALIEGDGAAPLPFAEVAAGPLVGTLVHAVLEQADFRAEDLQGELGRHLAILLPRVAPALAASTAGLAHTLVPALHAALSTPLGPALDELRLRDLARADRLDEVSFELPLAPDALPCTLSAFAERIAAWLPPGDPLAGYAEQLSGAIGGEVLRGYLTGTIDLVARLGRATGTPYYVVVDYKTNWLAARGEVLQAQHYQPAAMAAAMRHAHYPLQALLYTVALHRYLRGRQAGYDPEVHLGGVAYCFLRGMSGPNTSRTSGQPHGVFWWDPPAGLIVELSDLLGGMR